MSVAGDIGIQQVEGPSTKVGSSAKLCVPVFKASLLNYGGFICQSVFVCQVLCTGIQGIYALFVGVHWPKKVHLPSTSLTSRWGVYWPKKVHLLSTSLASRWGSIGQRRFICQVLVSLVGGGPLAKEGSSAKY